jgi:alkyl hydroperoxide reductase subunit F
MLEPALTQQLKTYLAMTTEPVVLVPSPGADHRSEQMMELLGEIEAAGDRVSIADPVPDDRTPSFAITRPGTDISVRFAGLPMGHEFNSLVLALLQVGGVPVKQDAALLDAVRGLKGHHEFTTYMSLTCQNCPTVVQALNAMSVVNPNIRHTAVEGGAFQDEINEHGIQSVPAIYLDGQEWGSGRMTMADILEKLDASAAAQAAEDLSERDPYDVLVVGSGPAGAAAAVYAARKGIRTAMVGERIGGQVLDTEAIENLISVPQTTGPKLGAALAAHVAAYDVDAIERQHATELIPAGEDGLTGVRFNGGELRAKAVVLATGARWRQLGVPGEQKYKTKGVTYCPHCDGPLFKGQDVAVVGGGNSGIEAAIDLAGVTGHVTGGRVHGQPQGRRRAAGHPALAAQCRRRHLRPVDPGGRGRLPRHRAGVPGPQHRRAAHHPGARDLRPDRPAAQHRVARGGGEPHQARRDHRQHPRRHLGSRRLRGWRLHHPALQADHHFDGFGSHRRARRLRPHHPLGERRRDPGEGLLSRLSRSCGELKV